MEYTYKLMDKNLGVTRSDGATIPADPNNTDFIEYLEWYAKGNRALPVDEGTL